MNSSATAIAGTASSSCGPANSVLPVTAMTTSSTNSCSTKCTRAKPTWDSGSTDSGNRTFFTSPELPTTAAVEVPTAPANMFQISRPDSR